MSSIEVVFRNLRYALRQLRKSPGFALVVVTTLALGIGANSAVFSAIDAVLLRPLPFPNPTQLTRILQKKPKSPETNSAAGTAGGVGQDELHLSGSYRVLH